MIYAHHLHMAKKHLDDLYHYRSELSNVRLPRKRHIINVSTSWCILTYFLLVFELKTYVSILFRVRAVENKWRDQAD